MCRKGSAMTHPGGTIPSRKGVRPALLLAGLILQLLFFSGCTAVQEEGSGPSPSGSAPHAGSGFIRYAKGFSLQHHAGFITLHIDPAPDGRKDTLRYILLPSGASVPKGFHGYVPVRTPVKRIAVFSTTHIGFIDMLGRSDGIIGVSRPEFVNTPAVRSRIRSGAIKAIGMPFSPDVEVLLNLDPDLVIAPALPAARKTDYQALVQAGIPVLVVAEWLEPSPLGRAEWIRLFGALFGREDAAREKFDAIERSYRKLAALTENVRERPAVLTGLPVKDTWFVPAGGSYVAALLHDAGAAYPWSDRPGTGSISLDIEAVYPVALEAPYWLNPGAVESMDELLAMDSRFQDMLSVKTGRVYNNNRWINAAGGNAYWEYGVLRPDLILRDLISILHPGLLPKKGGKPDSLTFYREIR
jgi:iron complex transport system substrate-binding protein